MYSNNNLWPVYVHGEIIQFSLSLFSTIICMVMFGHGSINREENNEQIVNRYHDSAYTFSHHSKVDFYFVY